MGDFLAVGLLGSAAIALAASYVTRYMVKQSAEQNRQHDILHRRIDDVTTVLSQQYEEVSRQIVDMEKELRHDIDDMVRRLTYQDDVQATHDVAPKKAGRTRKVKSKTADGTV